jgi:hypothetical protein
LSVLNAGFVLVKNSWRDNYPFEVRMDLEVANRLWFAENGEYGVITDR